MIEAAVTKAATPGFPCPAAPKDWTASASNPHIFGPAQQPGQQHTAVTCEYSKAPTHAVSVVGEYALPQDLNPFADFYYGCTRTQREGWTSSNRTYFVTSATRWSYVAFTDMGRQLPDENLGLFETVAKALLHRIEPAAHACHVNTTTPMVVRHLFLFGFEFFVTANRVQAFGGVAAQSARNVLIPAGSFSTTSSADSTVLSEVVAVKAPKIPMEVIDHGKKYTVFLAINGGIDFLQQPPQQRLRLRLKVVRSDYPKCLKGSSGTLSISRNEYFSAPNAPATIELNLCAAAFAGGKTRGTARIISG